MCDLRWSRAVLHFQSFTNTYLLKNKQLINYHSFPVTIVLNGKGFDGSTALFRTYKI